MATHDIEVLEVINTFVGWGVLALTIPKSLRERAVDLAIDIEMVSVLREQFLSYSSVPANGSYGKAVLVLQNFAEIEIELSQPRQRIYLWHSPEAYANRYAIELLDLNLLAHLATQQIACAILTNLLGACTPQPDPNFPKVFWAETPLREVYVKCRYGTVFRIEVSHKKFVPYQMLSTGQVLDMTSGWNDGEKDEGLPLSGSQPQVAEDEEDPYDGLPSPSSFEELGDFANGKVYNADIPNSDNEANLNHFLKLTAHRWIFDETGKTAEGFSYFPAEYGDFIVVTPRTGTYTFTVACGTFTYQIVDVDNNRGIRLTSLALELSNTLTAENIQAVTQPPDDITIVPNGICL
jgi:hypothetical protein